MLGAKSWNGTRGPLIARLRLIALGLCWPAALAAQLPDPSSRAVALGGAYTALARGYEAVAWNPALLALRGRPGFTLGLPQLVVEVGSNTYDYRDFLDNANRYMDDTVKQRLLEKISLDDSLLTLRALAGITPIGLSIGPIGLLVATNSNLELSVGRDAAELFLFGNARRTGPGDFFTASGSHGAGWAATTAAASFALPLDLDVGRVALGVTGKYVIGNFLGRGEETASRLRVNPTFRVHLAGHAVYTDFPADFDLDGPSAVLSGDARMGSGYGVDLGAAIQFAGRGVILSGVLVNALGSMRWDENRLAYEETKYLRLQDLNGAVSETTVTVRRTTPAQITADPRARALRDTLLAHADFVRRARFGLAVRNGRMSFSADAQVRLSDGLDNGLAQSVAAGLEYRLLGILPLRLGVGWDFGESTLVSAGTGLQLLGLNVDVSVANITGTVRPGAMAAVGVGLIF